MSLVGMQGRSGPATGNMGVLGTLGSLCEHSEVVGAEGPGTAIHKALLRGSWRLSGVVWLLLCNHITVRAAGRQGVPGKFLILDPGSLDCRAQPQWKSDPLDWRAEKTELPAGTGLGRG